MAVSPGAIGSSISGLATNMLPEMMRWTGIILGSAIILGAFWMVYILFQYNIIVYKMVLGENTNQYEKGTKYYVKGIKPLRARKVVLKGVPRFSYLFQKKTTDPIPGRFVMPLSGLLVKAAAFVYDVDGEIQIPSSVNFAINSPATLYFNPLPYGIKQAASLELHEIAKEYEDPGFMAKYGNIVATILTILFCLILVGAVIWMTYTYIGGELGGVTEAVKGLGDQFADGVAQKFSPK